MAKAFSVKRKCDWTLKRKQGQIVLNVFSYMMSE